MKTLGSIVLLNSGTISYSIS